MIICSLKNKNRIIFVFTTFYRLFLLILKVRTAIYINKLIQELTQTSLPIIGFKFLTSNVLGCL